MSHARSAPTTTGADGALGRYGTIGSVSDSGVNPPGVGATSGKPSRRQSSAAGMVGAMVITLLVIGGFVALRGFTRDQGEVEVASVDYQDAVAAAADSGLALVHPRELPDGWRATSVDLSRDESPAWAMGMLADEGRFVGIRQEEESADDMAAVAIDEDAVQGDDVRLDSEVADAWTDLDRRGRGHGLRRRVSATRPCSSTAPAPREDLTEIVALLQR